jgi:EmrB/QacA subfamily drug resistance transporter
MSTITSPPQQSAKELASTYAAAARRDRLRHWTPLAVLLTATCMAVLDFFIVNVALPSMQRSLHANPSAIEWVAAGYALTTAVLLIASGRLGDRFGRRRMFSAGLVLFTLSSAACGLAPSTTVLIGGRLIQGIGAALISTNMLALLGVLYSEPRERATAMAAYATVMGFAAVGGQLLGGALVQLDPLGLSWRSCFLINVPIGAVAIVAARRLVPESRNSGAPKIDLPGLALVTAGLTALVLPLVEGRQLSWPAWTWISMGAAPVILGAFVLQQRTATRRGGYPLIELGLFRRRPFSAGVLAQTVFWCGQGSFFLILALYLQQERDLTPLAAGGIFTTLAVPYVATSMRAPVLAARYGHSVITASALTLVAGHLALIATVAAGGSHVSVAALVPGLMIVGAGMGLGIAPLAVGLLSTLKPEQAGEAAGMLSTAQYVGSALGVALVGIAFFGAGGAGSGVGFEHGLMVLVAALAIVAGLSRLLP